jgi:glycine dehydrogenase subunit 1
MIESSGFQSFDQLIESLPASLRNPEISLPDPLSEVELDREIRKLAQKNLGVDQLLSFLGGGAYEHYIPATIDAIASRGEFLTAYTPYQAEASQGTLQVIYEYQTMMCRLTGLDVSNASLYDGASAIGEAVLLAINLQAPRSIILVPETMNHEYREVLKTYLSGQKISVQTIPSNEGVIDLEKFKALLSDKVAAVFLQTPNFFGCLESASKISELTHACGALLVSVVNPMSLGVIAPPGEYGADLAVGEGQPLGIPLSFGGPYLGFLTSKKDLVHKISGRIAGCTEDKDGNPGYCLTLQAREQHIRRERASSNICTNQALMALRATLYLSLVGKEGFPEVSELNYKIAHYLQQAICQIEGFSLAYAQPYFNEFVIRTPVPALELCHLLEDEGIYPGIPLSQFGHAADLLLVCATETKSQSDLERFLKGLKHVTLNQPSS